MSNSSSTKSDGSIENESGQSEKSCFKVIVIGGGPAGLSTALYTTRLNHRTALVDRGGGRAAMMLETHNVIGVPDTVSGPEFLQTALDQVEHYGCDIHRDAVIDVSKTESDRARFRIATPSVNLLTEVVVFATGFTDNRPDPPLPRTGRGLHYCLHCDAEMFLDEPVYVMGHDDSAANVAMIMLNFTDDVDLLLRGTDPTWSDTTDRLIRAHPVDIVEPEIVSMFRDEANPEWLGGFEFEDGSNREYKGGFAMYGSSYNNELAEEIGCDINDDGTVGVDEHGRTSVDGIYAVGDLTPGNKQIPIAMGEGAKAGIAINKELREFPRSIEDVLESPTT